MPAWGTSPIPWTATARPPYPMTIGDIEEVVSAHAAVAVNLLEAGLAGIEIQRAHGHLLQQFLSRVTNRREDAYGGSEENRMRFALEVARAVRAAVGNSALVGLRVSGDEFLEGGLALDDMCRIVHVIADAGSVDFINVSHSAYDGSYTVSTQMADMSSRSGRFVRSRGALRDALARTKNRRPS